MHADCLALHPHRSSLEPDLVYWRQTVQQLGQELTVSDVVEQAKRMLWSPLVGMLIVRNGTVYRMHQPDIVTFARNRVSAPDRILLFRQMPMGFPPP